jgi:hypothetical protein
MILSVAKRAIAGFIVVLSADFAFLHLKNDGTNATDGPIRRAPTYAA